MCLFDRGLFLKILGWVGVLLAIGSVGCRGRGALLRGFVVADAHFGWRHPQQPRAEEIGEAMERITKRFDDLDVFLDVGDAHHGSADRENEDWLGQWTDIIAGGCGAIPFYYTAGNHEIDTWNVGYDVERRCARLGSVSARPYYSFDIKGIHFISLPQLLFMSYVSKEALDWVKLDLELNKDKSVIFLAHNSVKGTTEYHDDPGYRRLANSDEILQLLDRYPNVLAWMHGHNHTYEVVEKGGKLFVSCGRIGGFDPPYEGDYGKGNLGGMYFEVGPGRLTVRGYSASKEMFFDEIGHPQHSKTLRRETSFDVEGPAYLSYGHGGAIDGQRMPVFNHHVSAGKTNQLFIGGADGPVINENPDFTVYTKRTHPYAPNPQILP
ncbi:MAG: metallophosphoesterase family protein, partial [Planctomycetota bacterium]